MRLNIIITITATRIAATTGRAMEMIVPATAANSSPVDMTGLPAPPRPL
jgi:hypothetical protein